MIDTTTRTWLPGVWAREVELPATMTARSRTTARVLLLTLASWMSPTDDVVRGHTLLEIAEAADLRDTRSVSLVLAALTDAGVVIRSGRGSRRWTAEWRPNRLAPVRVRVHAAGQGHGLGVVEPHLAPVVEPQAIGGLGVVEPHLAPVVEPQAIGARGQVSPVVEPHLVPVVEPHLVPVVEPHLVPVVEPHPIVPVCPVALVAPTSAVASTKPAVHESEAFTAFWHAYPRKVGRPKAALAFRSAVAHKTTPEAVMAGLAVWVAHWVERNEPQFIPHPTTWLHAEQWNDQPTAWAAKGQTLGSVSTRASTTRLRDLLAANPTPPRQLT